ncbi:MAG: RIP metalloprotease RseP [Nonlabens sp.]
MHPTVVLIINFLLSLSILIVLHELGHFIPARLFKIKVEKFYLFFDIKFSLFKKKIGETVYGIGWLPLGGYVKIAGMIDESMDKEQMAEEPKPWEFRSKPAWQRLIVMLGGVVVNVLVGFVIYISLVFNNGTPVGVATDYENGFGFPKVLEEVGFEQGDQPLLINADTLQVARMLNHRLIFRDVDEVTVIRDGQPVEISIPEDIGSRLFEAGVGTSLSARYPFEISVVDEGGYAEELGMEVGSTIKSIAGFPITYQTDVSYALNHVIEEDADFKVVLEKDGVEKTVTATNNEIFREEQFGITMNFIFNDIVPDDTRQMYSFGEAVSVGISKGYWTMHDYIVQFKYVFTKKGASQLGGFGTIAKLYPDTFDWTAFWATTAFISFILAIMNILPIPALDGGHVIFLLYEMITGRKPGDKFLERAQIVGIVILLSLMLYANGNDLFKALFN